MHSTVQSNSERLNDERKHKHCIMASSSTCGVNRTGINLLLALQARCRVHQMRTPQRRQAFEAHQHCRGRQVAGAKARCLAPALLGP
mmetsp:Transcript_27014/g.81775  ORF Transcript_27014/g.81775 Transcript_27014/m.81775 type:complete len:87 (-) Transcript_27014:1421-1681(-)